MKRRGFLKALAGLVPGVAVAKTVADVQPQVIPGQQNPIHYRPRTPEEINEPFQTLPVADGGKVLASDGAGGVYWKDHP